MFLNKKTKIKQPSDDEIAFIAFTEFPRAGFFRRLGSWVYDLLIGLAVYMVAGAVGFGLFSLAASIGLVSIGEHKHLIDVQQNSVAYSLLIYAWNLSWVAFFFIYFWARSGQTIGMKAWRLRVQNQDGSLISKKTGIKRILPTLLGLGNLWVIVERQNKISLQDKLTNTEVVVLSIEENNSQR